jgi:LemA protein
MISLPFTSADVAWIAGLAVLVFWVVGAYNRLVSLRGQVAKAFTPVEQQLRQRDLLLQRWLETWRPLVAQARQSMDAVSAACGQLGAALDVLCRRPVLAAPAATVCLAETTLADARQRLLAELPPALLESPEVELALAAEALHGADAALNFARSQFNDASAVYNAARRQFPTWLVAAVFGFRPAGTL